jgi:dienelactone hydrolase
MPLTLLAVVAVLCSAEDATPAPARNRLSVRPLEPERAVPGPPREFAYTCRQAQRSPDLDGSLREWHSVPTLWLGKDSVVAIRDYRGDADLSAKVQLQWDRDYLYFAAEVTDDEHLQRHGDGFLYHDDSLLLGFDALGDTVGLPLGADDYVYGFALADWGETMWRYEAPAVQSGRNPKGCRLVCKRLGSTTRYEGAIPWSELAPLMPVAQASCRFSVLVSDRDSGTGRREHEYVAWTRGLADPRDPSRFGTLVLEAAELPSYQSPEFYSQVRHAALDKGDPAQVVVGVNSGAETTVRLAAALCRGTHQETVLSEEVTLPKGLSRVAVDCLMEQLPPGQYRVLIAASRPDGVQLARAELPFVTFDSAQLLGAAADAEAAAAKGGLSPVAQADVLVRQPDVLVRSQAARELLLRGKRRGLTPSTLTLIDDMLQEVRALAETPASVSGALDRRVGWVVRGYRSEVDGSVQPYLVRLPDDYDPDAAYPLVVSLHYLEPGLTKAGWVARQFRQSWSLEPVSLPLRSPMVELQPFGRGNNWYRGLGEDDVLQAIAAVKQRYGIDPDRVYLTGGSMGGTGAWHIAARHPELFAAVATVCGHLEYAYDDEREFGDSTEPQWPRSFWQSGSPYFLAADLLNVPVYCHHGKEDTIVPVFQSQAMVRKLRELKYSVDYEEHSNVGHSGFPDTLDEDLRRWLLKQKRDPCPKRAVVRTNTLEQNQCYWLRIDRLEQMYRFGQVQAEAGVGEINAFAWSVREFTILVPEWLCKPGAPLRVTVMRKPAWEGAVPKSGELTFRRPGDGDEAAWQLAPEGPLWKQPDAPLMKRHGLQGPLQDVYNGPTVIAFGTAGSEETTVLLRTEALADREQVSRWYSADFQVLPDKEVTPETIEAANLILYGGPAENAVTARIADKLPIGIDGGALRVGERRLPGADVGTRFLYPNPLNPSRYVVVNMGVLPSALRGAGSIPWGLWDPLPDWILFRSPPSPPSPPPVVAEGMFGDEWQVVAESPLVVWHHKP